MGGATGRRGVGAPGTGNPGRRQSPPWIVAVVPRKSCSCKPGVALVSAPTGACRTLGVSECAIWSSEKQIPCPSLSSLPQHRPATQWANPQRHSCCELYGVFHQKERTRQI